MKTRVNLTLEVDGALTKVLDNFNKFLQNHTTLNLTLGEGCNGVEVLSFEVFACEEDYYEEDQE